MRRDGPSQRQRPLVLRGGATLERPHDALRHQALQRAVGGRGELRGLRREELEHREAAALQRRRVQEAQRVSRPEDHGVGHPDQLRDHGCRVDGPIQVDEAPHLLVVPDEVRERDAVRHGRSELRVEGEHTVERRLGAGEPLVEQGAHE